MDDQGRKLNTVKQIVAAKIDLIRFAVLHRKEIDNVSVEFAVDAFAGGLIAAQFNKYSKEEMLNAIVNGWLFEFKTLLVDEIMSDEEIQMLADMELKLV